MNVEGPSVGMCKGNLMIKHNAQILARGIQSILDKYSMQGGSGTEGLATNSRS